MCHLDTTKESHPMAKNYPDVRRVEFAGLIAQGKTGPEAGTALGINLHTVKDWLEREDVKAMVNGFVAKFTAKVERRAIYTREQLLEDYLRIARTPATETN